MAGDDPTRFWALAGCERASALLARVWSPSFVSVRAARAYSGSSPVCLCAAVCRLRVKPTRNLIGRVSAMMRCRLALVLATLPTAAVGIALTTHATRPASACRARTAVASAPSITVEHFLADLEYLGPCRFVVVGPGAILEAVGAFEELRKNDKGLATVSTDTGFECHIRLAEIKKAAFATKDSGGKTLHIIRLMSGESKPLLSAILSPENPGDEVEEGAIEYWSKLRQRFGDEFELLPE